MPRNLLKKLTPVESFLTIAIIVLLILFSVFLIRNIQLAHRSGVFQNHMPISELLLKNKQMNQTSARDIEYIDTWMTFQYINFVFDIRENYLKDMLHIEDVHYPNLSIERYIRNQKLDKAIFIEEIKKQVLEYMSLQPIK